MYSTDNGTTWLPATATDADFAVHKFTCTVPLERVIEQKFQASGRKRVVDKGRIKLTLVLQEDNFTPAADSSGAKLAYVQDWMRKPLLRVFLHTGNGTTGVSLDGRAYFASASNTVYVIPDEGAEPEIETENFKSITLSLESRDWID